MEVIGWRRNYESQSVPVTNYVLRLGDSVGKNERVTLFLEKLSSLGVHGLNLYDIAYNRRGEHSNYLIDHGIPVLFVYPPVKSVEDSPREWYSRNRVVIQELNRKYPGMFDNGSVGGMLRRRRSRHRRVRRRKTKKVIGGRVSVHGRVRRSVRRRLY